MGRDFIVAAELAALVREYRPDARLADVTRVAGSTTKGVYRLAFSDESTIMLYVWSATENYWPPGPETAGDPFAIASGAREFGACHSVLTAAGVRVPALYALDLSRRHYPAELALVEDLGSVTLEHRLAEDAAAAERPLAQLGQALRIMAAQRSDGFGQAGALGRPDGSSSWPAGAGPGERAEDVVLRRALRHLEAAVQLEPRLAVIRPELTSLVLARHSDVRPRREYGLVHGELGPDHVLLGPAGEPVLIDIEGLTYFDVEWEHAFLRLRFEAADYARLGLPVVDEARVSFYDLAQRISLVEGPLRIARTDYPGRDWMLELASWHTEWLIAAVRGG